MAAPPVGYVVVDTTTIEMIRVVCQNLTRKSTEPVCVISPPKMVMSSERNQAVPPGLAYECRLSAPSFFCGHDPIQTDPSNASRNRMAHALSISASSSL